MTIDDALDKLRKQEEERKSEERRVQEEVRKKYEEEQRSRLEEENKLLKEQLEKYRNELKSQKIANIQQDAIIRAHLSTLMNNWPEPKDDLDKKILQLITSSDFPEIYFNTLILKETVPRIEYLLMHMREKQLADFANSNTELFTRLAPLGLNLVCPYFEEQQSETDPFDNCHITGEVVGALCHGRHDICKVFKEYSSAFASGTTNYTKPLRTFKPSQLVIDEMERQMKEISLKKEIENYWRGE